MFNERRIDLFGRVAVRAKNNSSSHFKTAQSRALLAFLALSPRINHPRSKLAEAIWPGEGHSATGNRLSVALYNTKRLLDSVDPGFAECLECARDTVLLDDSMILIDHSEFRSSVQSARTSADVQKRRKLLNVAVGLYTAPLAHQIVAPWLIVKQIEAEHMCQESVVWLAKDLESNGKSDQAMNLISTAAALANSAGSAASLMTSWNIEHGGMDRARQYATGVRVSMAAFNIKASPELDQLIRTIDRPVAASTHAVVEIEESVLTILIARGVDGQTLAEMCFPLGAKATRDGNGFVFLSPLKALDAANSLADYAGKRAIIVHTDLMAEDAPVSSAALLALAQAPTRSVSCTSVCASLLQQRGIKLTKARQGSLWRLVKM